MYYLCVGLTTSIFYGNILLDISKLSWKDREVGKALTSQFFDYGIENAVGLCVVGKGSWIELFNSKLSNFTIFPTALSNYMHATPLNESWNVITFKSVQLKVFPGFFLPTFHLKNERISGVVIPIFAIFVIFFLFVFVFVIYLINMKTTSVTLPVDELSN